MAPKSKAEAGFQHPKQVLLGRGRRFAKHPSNKYYQDLIEKYVHQYYAESSASVKKSIATRIIEAVEGNFGGFLKWDTGTNEWVEIDQETAYQKVAHALQYRIRCLKRSGSISPTVSLQPQMITNEQDSRMLAAANAAYSETCAESAWHDMVYSETCEDSDSQDMETIDSLAGLHSDEESSFDLFVSSDFFEIATNTA